MCAFIITWQRITRIQYRRPVLVSHTLRATSQETVLCRGHLLARATARPRVVRDVHARGAPSRGVRDPSVAASPRVFVGSSRVPRGSRARVALLGIVRRRRRGAQAGDAAVPPAVRQADAPRRAGRETPGNGHRACRAPRRLPRIPSPPHSQACRLLLPLGVFSPHSARSSAPVSPSPAPPPLPTRCSATATRTAP